MKNMIVVGGLVSLMSCGRENDRIEPVISPLPIDSVTMLSPITELINADELIKDSVWKDGINHTVQIKIGPKFVLHSLSKEKIFPGAIVSNSKLLAIEWQNNYFEYQPVVLSIADIGSEEFNPSYENFISVINYYKAKNTKPFISASIDGEGRAFSTYSDLVLVNGYKKQPVENWLTINNRQSKRRKTGIVYLFKTVDCSVSIGVPRKGQLIDKEKYAQQIEADTLSYVNQIDIGKRGVLTFMCDAAYDVAQAIIVKLRKGESLSLEEQKVLQDGEIGYFLQGYQDAKIPTTNNAEIVKEVYNTIRTTTSLGDPIAFFVRGVKDLSPYKGVAQIDIIRQ